MRVMFRIFDGDLLALFPDEPATFNLEECLSYAAIGQHGAANLAYCYRRSTPATVEQYTDLLNELTCIGYTDLEIVDTIPRNARARRSQQLRQIQG